MVWVYNESWRDDPRLKKRGVPRAMGGDGKSITIQNRVIHNKTLRDLIGGLGKFVDGFDLIRTKFIPEGKRAYNNAHPAAQACMVTALTITEFGATRSLPISMQVPYDLYSGANHITVPTSPAGLVGSQVVTPLY